MKKKEPTEFEQIADDFRKNWQPQDLNVDYNDITLDNKPTVEIINTKVDYTPLQISILMATKKILARQRDAIKKQYDEIPKVWSRPRVWGKLSVAEIADIVFGKDTERTKEQLNAIIIEMRNFREKRKQVKYASNVFDLSTFKTHSIWIEWEFATSVDGRKLTKLEQLLSYVFHVDVTDWMYL